jgi:hypothetical protein
MLNARQLDLAVLFDTDAARRWSVTPLLEEAVPDPLGVQAASERRARGFDG